MKKAFLLMILQVFCCCLFVTRVLAAEPVVIHRLSEALPVISQELIVKQGIPAEKILVAIDLDNTLLTTPKDCLVPSARQCQYLGGEAWFEWQRKLIASNPGSPESVAGSFEDLIRVQNILFDAMSLVPTQLNLAHDWKSFANLGVSTLIETARAPAMMAATQREVAENKLTFVAPLFKKSKRDLWIPSKSTCGVAAAHKRMVAWVDNVYFVTAQDKGKMLRCLLNRMGDENRFKAVVLIDDKLHNLKDFANAFAHDYKVLTFHDQVMAQKVEAFNKGPTMAILRRQAQLRWSILNQSLHRSLYRLAY